MLSLLALVVAAPLVVVGSGDIDGTSTTISAITLDGVGVARCTLTHQRGMVPPGTLIDADHVALTLSEGSSRAGAVVVVDLQTCAVRELVDEVIANQAPVVVDGGVVVVRQLDADRAGATFDVVTVPLSGGPAEVLASRQALWVTPARGARTTSELRFLIGEGAGANDGHFHIDRIEDGDFALELDLGKGVFRSPVVVGRDLLVEVEHGKGAVLRDHQGRDVAAGLPGLSPVRAPGGDTLATSSGRKDGTINVNGIEHGTGRAGIARPQATGAGVVVVWLDRGASLPGELWAIDAQKKKSPTRSTRLLPPQARTAVMVYGITGGAR
ncbi:MAG: hypothetical protein Q8O67_15310 [Deltaproteobacteria bacterium]|nr:hypothetical protein [Deltaproteobacteria bacterium]